MIRQRRLPEWWHWPVYVGEHVKRRMPLRHFNEADLRAMLEDAEEIVPDVAPDRWLVRSRLGKDPWEIVVEPDPIWRQLVVVTAYPIE